MKILAPPISEGTDYRRMAVAESGGVYRFKLLKPAVFTFSDRILPVPQRLSFCVNGVEWMRLEPHRMIIAKGYAWNGNSIKQGYRILGKDFWLGTPDFEETISASLPHDSIFQFSGLREMPFSLTQANDFYEQICRAQKFKLSWAYSKALDEFSPAFWGISESGATCHSI